MIRLLAGLLAGTVKATRHVMESEKETCHRQNSGNDRKDDVGLPQREEATAPSMQEKY